MSARAGADFGPVLVTGATGFIGRRLCARLREEGIGVRALARGPGDGPWDERIPVDLLEPGDLAPALEGIDTVFHLAAYAHALGAGPEAAAHYRRINVDATRALLDAATAGGVARVIFASSVKAIGEGGSGVLDESSPERPTSDYGRTKLAAEQLVLGWGRDAGAHATVLRLPLVYGPGVKGNLERMLRAIRAGRFPPLPETGSRRSLVHVDDVATALLLAARSPAAAGRTYLVTDGRGYSTREIYELMCRACGREPARRSIPVAALRVLAAVGEAAGRLAGRRMPFDRAAFDRLCGPAEYSAALIERELGFRARRDLAGALPEMVRALESRPPGR